jgi:hypothetical protein
MKIFKTAIASIILSVSGIAGAADTVIYQVEVDGHLADGYHEIIKVVKNNDSYSVIESKGAYDWTAGGKLVYTTQLLDDKLECAADDAQLICRKDETPSDGPLVVYTFSCQAKDQDCKVEKATTMFSWATGELETKAVTLLQNGHLVLN